jgi:DNA-binding NarL/FixJ family response regulator
MIKMPEPVVKSLVYKVALVDDHRILLDGLQWIVSQFSFVEQVDAFSSGEDLLQALEGGSCFDLIITDIRMTPIDGLELLGRIKSKYPLQKVLIMTMYDSLHLLRDAFLLGAQGFFKKDGDQKFLEEVVWKLLQGGIHWPDDFNVRNAANLPNFTRREREVLSLVAQDLSSKEIATRLSLSVETVSTHRRNILEKAGLHSSAALVSYAIKHHLLI